MRDSHRQGFPTPRFHATKRAGAVAIILLIASGCAPRELAGHGNIIDNRESAREVELPEYVSYAAGTELADVTTVGLTSTFPANSQWLTLTGDSKTDVTIEMGDVGCWLLLRHGSSDDLGVSFTGEDATDTVATLVAHVGTSPESTMQPLWSGNKGTISVDSLVFVVVNDAGERVVALARAFGSLDSFVYVQLTCAPGVDTEEVFALQVTPYLSVALQ